MLERFSRKRTAEQSVWYKAQVAIQKHEDEQRAQFRNAIMLAQQYIAENEAAKQAEVVVPQSPAKVLPPVEKRIKRVYIRGKNPSSANRTFVKVENKGDDTAPAVEITTANSRAVVNPRRLRAGALLVGIGGAFIGDSMTGMELIGSPLAAQTSRGTDRGTITAPSANATETMSTLDAAVRDIAAKGGTQSAESTPVATTPVTRSADRKGASTPAQAAEPVVAPVSTRTAVPEATTPSANNVPPAVGEQAMNLVEGIGEVAHNAFAEVGLDGVADPLLRQIHDRAEDLTGFDSAADGEDDDGDGHIGTPGRSENNTPDYQAEADKLYHSGDMKAYEEYCKKHGIPVKPPVTTIPKSTTTTLPDTPDITVPPATTTTVAPPTTTSTVAPTTTTTRPAPTTAVPTTTPPTTAAPPTTTAPTTLVQRVKQVVQPIVKKVSRAPHAQPVAGEDILAETGVDINKALQKTEFAGGLIFAGVGAMVSIGEGKRRKFLRRA